MGTPREHINLDYADFTAFERDIAAVREKIPEAANLFRELLNRVRDHHEMLGNVMLIGGGESSAEYVGGRPRVILTFAPNDSVTTGTTPGQVPTPAISPDTGTYLSPQTVTITDSDAGATITYRVSSDGGATWGAWTTYTGSFSATIGASGGVVQAYATKTGWTNSQTAEADYTLSAGTVPTPVISPVTGNYGSPQSVTISDSDTAASIWYRVSLDGGSTWSTSWTNGGTGGTVTVGSTTIAAGTAQTHVQSYAARAGWTTSATTEADYTRATCATPVASPAGGSYSTTQSVTLTCATAGAAIYYTTDGSTPTTGSTAYTTAISVSSSETIKAFAVAAGYVDSGVMTEVYTIVATGAWTITNRENFTIAGGYQPSFPAYMSDNATAGDGYVMTATATNSYGDSARVTMRYYCGAGSNVAITVGAPTISTGKIDCHIYHYLADGTLVNSVYNTNTNSANNLGVDVLTAGDYIVADINWPSANAIINNGDTMAITAMTVTIT